jgi:hypothetical protein
MPMSEEDNQYGNSIPNGHYEQIDQFTWDLQAMIHRYKKEWDLPLESIVGAIEFVKAEITNGDYDIFMDAGEDVD